MTGGSRGIGLAIARCFSERGAKIVIAARNAERVGEAAAAIDNCVGHSDCDVRSSIAIDKLFQRVLDLHGRVDILVTSAGIGRGAKSTRLAPDPVATLEDDDFDDVLDTNLRGVFLAARAAARIMVAQGSGQILNISSARGARRGQAYAAAYCASKMAARAMLESMAAELAPLGIRVMSFLPDAVDTDLIAGTTLAPRGAMPAETVGRAVVDILCQPLDAVLEGPLLAPLGARVGGKRRQAS